MCAFTVVRNGQRFVPRAVLLAHPVAVLVVVVGECQAAARRVCCSHAVLVQFLQVPQVPLWHNGVKVVQLKNQVHAGEAPGI